MYLYGDFDLLFFVLAALAPPFFLSFRLVTVHINFIGFLLKGLKNYIPRRLFIHIFSSKTNALAAEREP